MVGATFALLLLRGQLSVERRQYLWQVAVRGDEIGACPRDRTDARRRRKLREPLLLSILRVPLGRCLLSLRLTLLCGPQLVLCVWYEIDTHKPLHEEGGDDGEDDRADEEAGDEGEGEEGALGGRRRVGGRSGGRRTTFKLSMLCGDREGGMGNGGGSGGGGGGGCGGGGDGGGGGHGGGGGAEGGAGGGRGGEDWWPRRCWRR